MTWVCESCGQRVFDSKDAHAAHHQMCARLTTMSEALTSANKAIERIAAERDALRERVDGLARDAERYRLARKICSFRFTCRNSMQVDLYDALEALFDALEDATAAEYAGAADKTLDAALAALGDK